MILQVFSIHDSKAAAYLAPFFQPTSALAVRMFTDAANDPESNICRHPEDFTLFHMGSYDNETNTFDLLDATTAMMKALQVKVVLQ